MRFRKLALFISAVSATSAALVVAACSDSTTTAVPTPTLDSSQSSSGSSGTSGTSGSSGGEDTGVTDAGADCESAPYLHAPPTGDAAFYCPFQDSGSAAYCAATDTCCDPAKPTGASTFPPSFCAPGKAVGQAAIDQACAAAWSIYVPGFFSLGFECDDSTSCPNGESCIAETTTYADAGEHVNVGKSTSKTIPAACNAKQLFQASGTHCITTPTTVLTQDQKLICTKDADCTTLVPGTTCVPASVSGRTLGVCVAP